MAFADDFIRIVTPRLQQAVKVQGLFVCIGCRSWQEGYYEVMHMAIERGALRLPQQQFSRLQDWIGRALLARIERIEAPWAETQRVSDVAWHGSQRTRRALEEIARG